MDAADLEPGFYRATIGDADVPPAHFQVTEEGKAVLVYPSGEVHRNDAAVINLKQDILPVATVEQVPGEETPFADDVQPRPDEGPDPEHPVE